MTDPQLRPASRVLLIDEQDHLLLFRAEGDFEDASVIWFAPGGGLEDGETHEEAALRELWEETGIVAPLGPCVWTRRHVWRWRDRRFDQRERYYVARVAGATVAGKHLGPEEIQAITGHRWWSLPDIVSSNETFVPRRLAEYLPAILGGDFPSTPFDCGVERQRPGRRASLNHRSIVPKMEPVQASFRLDNRTFGELSGRMVHAASTTATEHRRPSADFDEAAGRGDQLGGK